MVGYGLDAGKGGLGSSGGHDDCGSAKELLQLGGADAANTVALEKLCEGACPDPAGLRRSGNQLPQIEEPRVGDAGSGLKDLRVVAPELFAHSVAERGTLAGEVFGNAGPLAQFDDDRIRGMNFAKAVTVGTERVGEHAGVATVVLGPGRREAVAKAVELLRIDRVKNKAPVCKALDDGAVRNLNGHEDVGEYGSRLVPDPHGHFRESFSAVAERALAFSAALRIDDADIVLLRTPVHPCKPVVLCH